jgi:hypothetical protein
MRAKFPDLRNHFAPAKFDIDTNLDMIMDNIHDPFGFCNSEGAYVDFHWSEEQCMDAVTAGISESLGLPQGLSFEEVFAQIS